MKIALIALMFMTSCGTVEPGMITPKIAKIRTAEKEVCVWVWHRDSWLVACMDSLPQGWRKGTRIPIYPQTDVAPPCCPQNVFKRVGGTRPW